MKLETTEMFEKIWDIYPKDLCHNRKGSRPEALKALNKYSDELQKRIYLDIIALRDYDRKQHKPDRWPYISTFLNQRRFERTIDTVEEVKEVKIKYCKCGSIADVKGVVCQKCVAAKSDRYLQKRKNVLTNLLNLSPGQSRQDVIDRCKELMLTKVQSGEAYKTAEIPYLKSLSRPLEVESTQSNTEVIYGEDWFRENAEKLRKTLGIKIKA